MVLFSETEPSLEIEIVRKLEKKLHFDLPLTYVNHILKFNGGRCKPNIFSFEENGKLTQSSIDWFLAIYNGEFDNFEEYFKTYKIDKKRMPNSFFPIAHDSGGNLICMNTLNDGIYFWDHEKELAYDSKNDEERGNLYFIAKSIDDFLSTLT